MKSLMDAISAHEHSGSVARRLKKVLDTHKYGRLRATVPTKHWQTETDHLRLARMLSEHGLPSRRERTYFVVDIRQAQASAELRLFLSLVATPQR